MNLYFLDSILKKLLQNLGDGSLAILNAPQPLLGPHDVLIHTKSSPISVGTEKILVGFRKRALLTKARSQPDKVKEVLKKANVGGVFTTVDAVRSKLGESIPLRYSSSGTVLAVCESFSSVAAGDLVASHGDQAVVNEILCVKVPDGVDADSAAFTVVASIGLQGIWLIGATLGVSVVVLGVGLIGLLVVILLVAHGCWVMAVDHDANKLALAATYGASVCNLSLGKDPVSKAKAFSGGRGADAALKAASTDSIVPMKQSALMCRPRGRVALIGVVGLNLDLADFYEKDIRFQVSCSYGPGWYDPNCEEKGQDYPVGFVRWTEKRNFEAILDLMSVGRLVVDDLISKRYPFEDAEMAYEDLTCDNSLLGVLFNYAESDTAHSPVAMTSVPLKRVDASSVSNVAVGFLGAGNYASRMLIPAFKSHRADFHTLVSFSGVSGVLQGNKHAFRVASTDSMEVARATVEIDSSLRH